MAGPPTRSWLLNRNVLSLTLHRYGPYAEQWCQAAKVLAAATQLVFIGYSFPETDAYMRYFLGASLAENVALEAIHIIDPKADEIVNRLGHSGQYGAHFLDMLKPYNRCWHLN